MTLPRGRGTLPTRDLPSLCRALSAGDKAPATLTVWCEDEATGPGTYFSCWRQLLRFLRGSLLTAGGGLSSSSSREAGTGQSGTFTGVMGLEGLASPFSSFLCF